MLGKTIHITSEYLSHEEKVVVVRFKVEALKAETGKMKRASLLSWMKPT